MNIGIIRAWDKQSREVKIGHHIILKRKTVGCSWGKFTYLETVACAFLHSGNIKELSKMNTFNPKITRTSTFKKSCQGY